MTVSDGVAVYSISFYFRMNYATFAPPSASIFLYFRDRPPASVVVFSWFVRGSLSYLPPIRGGLIFRGLPELLPNLLAAIHSNHKARAASSAVL